MDSINITAIVTAYNQPDKTIETLNKFKQCNPSPSEIIVHVDGGKVELQSLLQKEFPDIKIILSQENIGPGGGRNKLIKMAQYDLIASFDDDSYPLDIDYFDRLLKLFTGFPDASIITAKLYHQNELIEDATEQSYWVADFAGCACAYRKSIFFNTTGYIPLPIAYGMEEVDLALRLHAQGYRILQTDFIRVFHNTDRKRHSNHRVTSSSLANIALLAFLRYPILCWFIGLLQLISRIIWLIKNQRYQGIATGIIMIPQHLWTHRQFRQTVSASVLLSYLSLKRKPLLIESII
ncbi:family 2 glycosyl transferase [Picosynechococcus sp. PCC 7003]|uniref:glycosyltransferase family 2 protein n=1 Tax=Picosynechococcus sp. PCC 7003 TaxID=374981 RepID=UPI000810519B|nr:glycosyltransferase [Picosynechococcus sp. PCC 7003]ANV84736.1 family 2 glycosyl transferase [Picosynechococcus sp. PCC 7003]